jgi:hypothetical protein
MEAMRKTVATVTGEWEDKSWTPEDPTCTRRPSITMPHTIPGIFLAVTYSRKIPSMSGKADSSFEIRSGSVKRAGG